MKWLALGPTISNGGRLVLIQSVLSSIPAYFLSLFRILIKVAACLEKLMRDFLWEGSEESKRDHLVKWEVVSRSKHQGGLAVGNIVKKNIALTSKWLWRFPLESESLWHVVIKSKYGVLAKRWDAQPSSRILARCAWKFIAQGLEGFLGFISLLVGKGDRVCFWEDHWRGNSPFYTLIPRLYRLSLSHNVSISTMASSDALSFGWDFNFIRNLNDRESLELASLLVLLEGFTMHSFIPDRRVWTGDSSGLFPCKSYFDKLIESHSIHSFTPADAIWKASVPLKVKFFAWTVVLKRINTNELFQKRRPSVYLRPQWCVMCKQAEERTDHLLCIVLWPGGCGIICFLVGRSFGWSRLVLGRFLRFIFGVLGRAERL